MSASNPASILDPILSPLTGLQDEQVAMTLLAAGLCQVMGFDTVLLGNPPRCNSLAAVALVLLDQRLCFDCGVCKD